MLGTNEIQRALADPFLSQRYRYVLFDTLTPGRQIVHYYDKIFHDFGWTTQRSEVLALEYTNSGGDIVRVYSKAGSLVQLHVFGSPEEPDHGMADDLTVWQFQLAFLGITPESLLGPHYRLKGHEILCPNYHFADVIRNQRETDAASNQSTGNTSLRADPQH